MIVAFVQKLNSCGRFDNTRNDKSDLVGKSI